MVRGHIRLQKKDPIPQLATHSVTLDATIIREETEELRQVLVLSPKGEIASVDCVFY
jgi:hypothetical protein